ncbi:MAG: bifunctional nuclease family protein [Pyrinomonadaceae bacterium]
MLIEVKIGALIMDPNSNTPIVVLKGVETERILPIWVGAFEANAIALEIEKVVPQRPMTHDLLRNFIIELGFEVSKIVITDLKENTFYAQIELLKDGEITFFDSRPSDAIALALRSDCPIYVKEEVFDLSGEASEPEIEPEITEEESPAEDWPELLD